MPTGSRANSSGDALTVKTEGNYALVRVADVLAAAK